MLMNGTKGTVSTPITLDRIEGDFAILIINNHTFTLPVSILPPDYKEGMSYRLSLTNTPQQEDALKSNIERLQSNFIRGTPGEND
jgi:hypothetical protein